MLSVIWMTRSCAAVTVSAIRFHTPAFSQHAKRLQPAMARRTVCWAAAVRSRAIRSQSHGESESEFAITGMFSVASVRRICFTTRMRPWATATIMLAMLAAMLVLGGCNRPISDPGKLQAIRAEAQALVDTYPPEQPNRWRNVPAEQWPSVIASLQPQRVEVYTWGVDITIKAGFDGGWGYAVPRRKSDLPMPTACYSEPGPGVFWHGPC